MFSTALLLLLATASKFNSTLALTRTDEVDIRFIDFETHGENYRRLLEPMNQFSPPAAICATSQVFIYQSHDFIPTECRRNNYLLLYV